VLISSRTGHRRPAPCRESGGAMASLSAQRAAVPMLEVRRALDQVPLAVTTASPARWATSGGREPDGRSLLPEKQCRWDRGSSLRRPQEQSVRRRRLGPSEQPSSGGWLRGAVGAIWIQRTARLDQDPIERSPQLLEEQAPGCRRSGGAMSGGGDFWPTHTRSSARSPTPRKSSGFAGGKRWRWRAWVASTRRSRSSPRCAAIS
jgi:hypothetical protein